MQQSPEASDQVPAGRVSGAVVVSGSDFVVEAEEFPMSLARRRLHYDLF